MLRITQTMKTFQGLSLIQHFKGASTSGSLTSTVRRRYFASAPPPPLGSLEPLLTSEAPDKYLEEMIDSWTKNQSVEDDVSRLFKAGGMAQTAGLAMILEETGNIEPFLRQCSDDPAYFPPYNGMEFAKKQLSAANIIVANCSRPSAYFNILRRQIMLPFRKPLVIRAPRSIFQHGDTILNSEIKRLIPDDGPASLNPDCVQKLIFCTGRIYFDLLEARRGAGLQKDIAISTIEQISPFPFDLFRRECEKYPKARLVFAQEEHEDQGTWSYVQPRAETAIDGSRELSYCGRSLASASASEEQRKKEYVDIFDRAMQLPLDWNVLYD